MAWQVIQPWRRTRGNKLGAVKSTYNGKTFDSQREANRYAELELLQRAGKISALRCQVKYELIPAIYDEIPTGEIYKRGPLRGQPKMKRVCVERGVEYVADFEYIENGEKVVEDAKGFRDTESAVYKVFVIKRKLMLYFHGIRVKEV